MKPILAIDPGALGGFALWTPTVTPIVLYPMPKDAIATCELLREIKADWPDVQVFLEMVGGYVKGNPTPGSTMFSFGAGYGFLRGCCVMGGLPLRTVRPQEWQKPLGVPKFKSADRKRWLCDEARARFPDLKITLKTCDALLILDYVQGTGCVSQDAFAPKAKKKKRANTRAKSEVPDV